MAMKPFSLVRLFLLTYLIVLAVSALNDDDGSDEKNTYKLEWIGEPEIKHLVGKTQTVSSYVDSGNHGSEIQVQDAIVQTYELKKGLELEVNKVAMLIPKFIVAEINKNSNRSALTHKIPMDRYSIGIAKFRENIINFRGRVRKTYLWEWLDCFSPTFVLVKINNHCYRPPEEFDFELNKTELDEVGKPVGHYWIEYMGTDKYKHPKFYNLVNKTADFSNSLPVDDKIKSAYECGQRAIELEHFMALYDVAQMKCFIREVDANNGVTFDKQGFLMGSFNVRGNDKHVTDYKDIRDRWANNTECDLIYSNPNGKFHCKQFPSKPGFVLMIRRNSRHFRDPDEHSSDDEHPHDDEPHHGEYKHSIVPKITQITLPHPSFYHLSHRDHPAQYDSIEIPHVTSAHDCGDEVITRNRFTAVYKPRENTCIVQPATLSHGRTYDSQGRLLGPYDLRLRDIDQTNTSSKRESWMAESKCDFIHDSPDNRHWCKMFDPTDQDYVVMMRYISEYETQKMYNEFKEKENERLIYSEARHWKFYSIKDKTYKPSEKFERIKNIESPYECGQFAISKSLNVATYSFKTKNCRLIESNVGSGETRDRWNKLLGSYELIDYDRDQTRSIKVLESWLNPYQCDLIFTSADGTHWCKDFPYEEGSVLMFKKHDK